MHKGNLTNGEDANPHFKQLMASNKMKYCLAKQNLEGIFGGKRFDDDFDMVEKKFELAKLVSLREQLWKRKESDAFGSDP